MLAEEFIRSTAKRLRYYKHLADATIAQLDTSQLLLVPAPGSNSISVIIRHLAGNMLSRWSNFLTEDGEKSWRNRDGEFEEKSLTREELLDQWERAWSCALNTLEALRPEDLMCTIYIREEPLLAVDAIGRQLAHAGYHIGQIVYAGKLLKGEAFTNLSIPRGESDTYNRGNHPKDPAKRF